VIALLDRYVDQRLSVGERTRVEEHLAQCPMCRQELSAIQEMTGVFSEGHRPDSAGVRRARQHRDVRARPVQLGGRVSVLGGMIAVVLVVAVFIGHGPDRRSRPASDLIGSGSVLERLVKPDYPVAAQQAGEEGRVVVQVHVDSFGQVLEARVGRSSGFGRLDSAAAAAAAQSDFRPYRRNGRRLGAWVTMAFEFILKEQRVRLVSVRPGDLGRLARPDPVRTP